MENPENNSLSENQQERMIKISEFLDIIHSIAKQIEDSNQAFEIGVFIKEFEKDFNNDPKNIKKNIKLKQFSLGQLILSPNNFDITKSELDDTDDGKIAKFIKEKLAFKILNN